MAANNFREVAILTGQVEEEITSQLWGNGLGNALPHGYKPEDPELTGGDPDGMDGRPIVLADGDGNRFSVEVVVYVNELPLLEEDPDYIAVQRAAAEARAEEERRPLPNPNQEQLF